jgi:Ca2+-binding EF-hand superfamily protein
LASKTDFAKLFSKFTDISGVKVTPEKFCDFLFKLFDKNDDGRVSFGEFTIAFGLSASNLTEKNLLSYADKLFDLLDKNRDNKLNKKEISFLVESIFDLETSNQNNLVKNEVAEVLDVYSEKESGFLNREEFAEFFIDGQIFEYFFGVASVIQHGALDTVQNQPKN